MEKETLRECFSEKGMFFAKEKTISWRIGWLHLAGFEPAVFFQSEIMSLEPSTPRP